MKILLFGKNGQVGWELQRSLAPLGEVVALGSGEESGLSGDFRDPSRLAQTVRTVRPDVVVNAAAYTAVDRAESDAETAMLVNGISPGVLAEEAQSLGALLIHYSTDYVYDGSGQRAWTELDQPAPLSVYGRSKLEGDQRVARACARHLILRTSWAYGARGGNFAKTMLRLASQRDRLTVVNDQFGAPTGADLLADLTAHMLRATMADPKLAGLYNVAAAGETSWHGYAVLVIEAAQRAGMALKATSAQVDPVPTSHFPTPARRPSNSRLDTSKLRRTFGLVVPAWEAGVIRMLEEILGQGQEHLA